MNPNLVDGKLSTQDAEIIRKKITLIFLTAIAHNHDAVILTAFGCGYARNPPHQVAEIFSQVIEKFKNHFSNIAFAIIDNANARKNSPEGNIIPFKSYFEILKKPSNAQSPPSNTKN